MIAFEKPTSPSMTNETNHCVLPRAYADNIEKSIKRGHQFVTPSPNEQRQVSANDNDEPLPISKGHDPHCRQQNHQVEHVRHPSHPRDSKHLRMLHAYKRLQRTECSPSEVKTPRNNNARRRDGHDSSTTPSRNTTQQLGRTPNSNTQLVRRDSKHSRMIELHVPELFQIPIGIVPCSSFDAGSKFEIMKDGGQQLSYTYIVSPLDVICTGRKHLTRHPGNLFFDYLVKTNIEALLNQPELPELVDAVRISFS